MSLISVGIHENLEFSEKSKINDKGTLELSIRSVQSEDALLEAFTNNTTFQSMESSIRFYPPSLKDFDQKIKSSAEISADLLKMRHQFLQYAYMIGTKEEAQNAIGGLKMFEGIFEPTAIATALTQLNQEPIIAKVTTNLSTKFLDYLKSKNVLGTGTFTFRQKFLRQSKAKNYAVIPTSDFDVWVEPMTVPKEQSKIAYSEWEITNGKNNPAPVASDAKTTDAPKAASLFGGAGDANAGMPDAPVIGNAPVLGTVNATANVDVNPNVNPNVVPGVAPSVSPGPAKTGDFQDPVFLRQD